MQISKNKLKVVEIYPYTRSSIKGVRAVLKQPSIVFKHGSDTYYMTGKRLLWSFYDRVIGPDYSRKDILDALYCGPLEDFKEGLQSEIQKMKDEDIVFHFCNREEFQNEYGINPMSDASHTVNEGIVKSVSVPSEEELLLHVLNTMKDYDVPMNYDGVSGKVNHSQRITATVHEFSEKKHEGVLMRMRIVINEKGTATIEAWTEGDGWEASPFDSVGRLMEFDPRFLGPALKRYYVSLSDLSAMCCKSIKVLQASWLRQEEKMKVKEKYGDKIEKNALMFYRLQVARESEAV